MKVPDTVRGGPWVEHALSTQATAQTATTRIVANIGPSPVPNSRIVRREGRCLIRAKGITARLRAQRGGAGRKVGRHVRGRNNTQHQTGRVAARVPDEVD